ncbi:MAG: hypothetical protein NVSMB26_23150 [Beijerinckiaceae bacterium]
MRIISYIVRIPAHEEGASGAVLKRGWGTAPALEVNLTSVPGGFRKRRALPQKNARRVIRPSGTMTGPRASTRLSGPKWLKAAKLGPTKCGTREPKIADMGRREAGRKE